MLFLCRYAFLYIPNVLTRRTIGKDAPRWGSTRANAAERRTFRLDNRQKTTAR